MLAESAMPSRSRTSASSPSRSGASGAAWRSSRRPPCAAARQSPRSRRGAPASPYLLCEVGRLDEAAVHLDVASRKGVSRRHPQRRRPSLHAVSPPARSVAAVGDGVARSRCSASFAPSPAAALIGFAAYHGAVDRYLGLLAMTVGRDDQAVARPHEALAFEERMAVGRGWRGRSTTSPGRSWGAGRRAIGSTPFAAQPRPRDGELDRDVQARRGGPAGEAQPAGRRLVLAGGVDPRDRGRACLSNVPTCGPTPRPTAGSPSCSPTSLVHGDHRAARRQTHSNSSCASTTPSCGSRCSCIAGSRSRARATASCSPSPIRVTASPAPWHRTGRRGPRLRRWAPSCPHRHHVGKVIRKPMTSRSTVILAARVADSATGGEILATPEIVDAVPTGRIRREPPARAQGPVGGPTSWYVVQVASGLTPTGGSLTPSGR